MQIFLLAAALALSAQTGKPDAAAESPAQAAPTEPEGDSIGGRELP